MRVWRCVDNAFLAGAWTGEGARLHGGRWNEKGFAVVYCSESPALALLEVMAGGIKPADLHFFSLLYADVPDGEITDAIPGHPESEIGAAWLATTKLGMRVPSRVVPGSNILLNPNAPEWDLVVIGEAIRIDPRLWEGP
ncbi:MAG: RES family NAD+ phosphorylase [Halobacteriales archaeon]|nr:RES family NAD+ phosphorylase [Halobacteriales archaeon]